MVCDRCTAAVRAIFEDLNIDISSVGLGEVETLHPLSEEQLDSLDYSLRKRGFEILEDAVKAQVEQIKKEIILEINKLDLPENFVLSKFISEKFNRDYSSLSKSFSVNETVTLEQYFILQKIEKVKELLFYNELTLTEISHQLGYKSVQYLSTQFKNTTGFTPSSFKKLKSKNRISLDQI